MMASTHQDCDPRTPKPALTAAETAPRARDEEQDPRRKYDEHQKQHDAHAAEDKARHRART